MIVIKPSFVPDSKRFKLQTHEVESITIILIEEKLEVQKGKKFPVSIAVKRWGWNLNLGSRGP